MMNFYQFCAGVYDKNVNGKILILSPHDKSNVFELNKLGSFLWKNIEKSQSIETLTNKVVKKFDVSKKQARKDILSWLDEMISNELIDKKSI